MSYIKWTPEEWKKLAKRYAELRSMGKRKKESFFGAQVDVLPQERHRFPEDASALYKRLAVIAGILDDDMPKGVSETQRVLAELRGRINHLESEIVTLRAIMRLDEPRKLVANYDEHLGQRRPKVAIVGLRPNQAAEIEAHYGSLFDLRVYPPEANHFEWCAHARRVVLMNGHVTSEKHRALRRLGVPLLYCNGAASALKPILDGLKVSLHA